MMNGTTMGQVRKTQVIPEDPTVPEPETIEQAMVLLNSMYTPDMSDYERTDYDDEGALQESVAVWQTEVVERGDLTLLHDRVDQMIEADDAEELLKFMAIYLDPQIIEFDSILPQIYSYIWELAIVSDAVNIAQMLLSKMIILGFEGDAAFLESYYNTFWSYCTDAMIDIIFTIYPADDFFYYCSNYLYILDPSTVNIRRFYEYIDYFNSPDVYSMPNNYQSIYDMACFFRPEHPDVFNVLAEMGLPFNREQYPISPRNSMWLSELDPANPTGKFDSINRLDTLLY